MSPTVDRSSKLPAQPRIQLNVAIPPGLKARLTIAATKRGSFESALVREALELYLDASERGGRR